MKGVILAGGLGTRLDPLTRVTNKHLLPVFDRPMIYYPLQLLVDAGVQEVMIVTGGNNAGDFLRLLRNGEDFGLSQIHFAYQDGEGGIADALGLAEHFVGNDRVCVVLGDNILENSIRPYVEKFRMQPRGARILLKKVPDPERFGVPILQDETVVRIVEKPKTPPSSFAVTGVYMYDQRVFEIIKSLKPSQRGELEITDVNNQFIEWGDMAYDILDGWWTDAGTVQSLLKAAGLVAKKDIKEVSKTSHRQAQTIDD